MKFTHSTSPHRSNSQNNLQKNNQIKEQIKGNKIAPSKPTQTSLRVETRLDFETVFLSDL